jgi:hypothetical protein
MGATTSMTKNKPSQKSRSLDGSNPPHRPDNNNRNTRPSNPARSKFQGKRSLSKRPGRNRNASGRLERLPGRSTRGRHSLSSNNRSGDGRRNNKGKSNRSVPSNKRPRGNSSEVG